MIAIGLVNAVVLPHPAGDNAKERRHERAASTQMTAVDFVEAFKTFLTQPQAVRVISFMFLYRLGDIMMGAMSKPMLRDIGVDLQVARAPQHGRDHLVHRRFAARRRASSRAAVSTAASCR